MIWRKRQKEIKTLKEKTKKTTFFEASICFLLSHLNNRQHLTDNRLEPPDSPQQQQLVFQDHGNPCRAFKPLLLTSGRSRFSAACAHSRARSGWKTLRRTHLRAAQKPRLEPDRPGPSSTRNRAPVGFAVRRVRDRKDRPETTSSHWRVRVWPRRL